jgi:hypothetical protein
LAISSCRDLLACGSGGSEIASAFSICEDPSSGWEQARRNNLATPCILPIARQAQNAITATFGGWISCGARGAGQPPATAVALTGSGHGQNVFDGSDQNTRMVTLGQPLEHYAFETIKWVVLNTSPARDALNAHHWSATTEGWDFLQDYLLKRRRPRPTSMAATLARRTGRSAGSCSASPCTS